MKNLLNKLYFTAGLVVTIKSANRWLGTKNAKQMEADFNSSMKELNWSESTVRTCWSIVVILSMLISWPLWVWQVIIDYTNK